jgi:hypothetical protein
MYFKGRWGHFKTFINKRAVRIIHVGPVTVHIKKETK